MRWLIVPASAAFSLAVSFSALATAGTVSGQQVPYTAPVGVSLQLAQNDQHDRRGGHQGGQQGEHQGGQQGGHPTGGHPGNIHVSPTGPQHIQQGGHPTYHGPVIQQQHQYTPQIQQHQRYDWRQYQPGHRPADVNRYRRNFDRNQWQRNYRAERRFHWGSYHRPTGWFYRRWAFGMILPSLFWTRDYWINSYWSYDLPAPPYGYVWVRYGDDALLVDVETGYILRVIYGVFD
ncbi:MAG: RcnB family protein [Alphaproteobacteria bacterium]|nr:RcnB family protein [Alphaproteobacteria bacterium]MDE2013041.1 RcnB family protein [Alphaproteobacteria bacterium]MDE2073901.1 RcnB family protein [Alphaproteobacteria bacterium]MDE2350999.1 RcnB family protein [Alphaproteobacteria bacterium]